MVGLRVKGWGGERERERERGVGDVTDAEWSS